MRRSPPGSTRPALPPDCRCAERLTEGPRGQCLPARAALPGPSMVSISGRRMQRCAWDFRSPQNTSPQKVRVA
eukprot:1089440-Alexandrium_andersonii.AAC.1